MSEPNGCTRLEELALDADVDADELRDWLHAEIERRHNAQPLVERHEAVVGVKRDLGARVLGELQQ
jgi:hypothetical protein